MNKASLLFISTIILLALTLALAGCNKPQGSDGVSAKPPATTPSDNKTTPIAAQKGVPKLIELGAST
jgi:hypothetical protein